MIAKIGDPRGRQVGGLIYYLFGPGRREEHADPHLIAGWRYPAELEPPLRPDGRRDFRRLTGLLRQAHAALGARGFDRPVWHCSVRAAPEDRMLSDDEWAQIAGDVMHRTALSPCGQDDDAVRWIAVRHGPDHIPSSRCWPGRTAAGPGYRTSGTASGRPAAPLRNSTDCGAPRREIGRLPAAPPARSRRRPGGAVGRKYRG
jgi:hypothetical protein